MAFFGSENEFEKMIKKAQKMQKLNGEDPLYVLEFERIKSMVFNLGKTCLLNLIHKEGYLWNAYLLQCTLMNKKPKYGMGSFDVVTYKNKNGLAILKIIYPTPERSPLCYCAYVTVRSNGQAENYYTLERDINGGEPVLCGYQGDIRFNYGSQSVESMGLEYEKISAEEFEELIGGIGDKTAERKTTANEESANAVPAAEESGNKKTSTEETMEEKTEIPPVQAEQIQDVSEKIPSWQFCRKCGAKIPSDSVFCNKCGTKVLNFQEQKITGQVQTFVKSEKAPVVKMDQNPDASVQTAHVSQIGQKPFIPESEFSLYICPKCEQTYKGTDKGIINCPKCKTRIYELPVSLDYWRTMDNEKKKIYKSNFLVQNGLKKTKKDKDLLLHTILVYFEAPVLLLVGLYYILDGSYIFAAVTMIAFSIVFFVYGRNHKKTAFVARMIFNGIYGLAACMTLWKYANAGYGNTNIWLLIKIVIDTIYYIYIRDYFE